MERVSTTENFRAYYDDVNLRMKKKKTDMEPLDLCWSWECSLLASMPRTEHFVC